VLDLFKLDRVPSVAEVPPLVETLRTQSGVTPEGVVDLRRICRSLRVSAHQAPLAAADGGQDAMLVPLPGNRFEITVDPSPKGGWRRVPKPLRTELKRHRYRFRIGHELAHTFFYSRDADRPRRVVFDSTEQEEFCDAFARELLVPRHRAARAKPTARALLKLQASCDVSLELAARALSAAHEEIAVGLWFMPPGASVPQLQWSAGATPSLTKAEPLDDDRADGFAWLPSRRQLLFLA
jgi:hypothetical protein